MSSRTVRIDDASHAVLRQLAEQLGESMQEILSEAIEFYRRQQFLEEANRAYAALRSNPVAWKEELEERAAWDNTLMDDLENDE